MTNGKKEGTYLEVGAGYPKKGNNTFLLEKEFDWKGISVDINPKSKELFDKNRKNKCICTDAVKMDYNQVLEEHYKSKKIDYLQLDCDPANITYDILQKIPFDSYKFGVITYEHDYYNDETGSYREKSRVFLKGKGYKLICGNISPLKDKYPFEDWWIHPDLIDYKIWKLFLRNDDEPINGEKYMLTKKHFLNKQNNNNIKLEVQDTGKKNTNSIKIGLDIGACSGTTINLFDDCDIIYAFEPNPLVFRQLEEFKNKHKNKYKIVTYDYAISDRDGTALFNIMYHHGYSSLLEFDESGNLFKHCDKIDNGFNKLRTRRKVQTKRLDTFIEENNIQNIHFIKIDTQGSDLAVIKSLGKYIKNVYKIQAEIQTQTLYKNSSKKKETIEFMKKNNFDLVDIIQNSIATAGYEERLTFINNSFIDSINQDTSIQNDWKNNENRKALVLSNNILDNFILKNSEFFDFDANTEKYDYLKSYNNLSGINEYRLYSYLSTLFNNITILDIGTGYGTSAIALSHNETNQVISYNIVDQIGNDSKLKTKKNIIFKIKNVLEDLNEEFIKNVKIVMIDIDHFGEEEKKIINKLEELNYSGIILLDDIHHPWEKESKCMKQLWEYIKYTKYDITKYGHNTGTGIFLMNFNIDIIFSESPENEENDVIKKIYDFIPCHDQRGNDLYRVKVEDIEQVLKKEYNNPQVKGVNTKGYVKNNIEKLEQINGWGWDVIANKADGIYIKKTSNNTLVKCSKSSIPVLGTLVCTTTKWIEKQIQSIDFPVENYIIINNNENFLAEKLDILVSKGNKFIKNFKVYHMPYNLGCAEGWNTIIKSFLFSPYWVIVNDDVSFTPGFLKELHETALENPDAGLIHGNPCNLDYLTKFGSFDMFLIRDWIIKDFGLFDTNFYPAYKEDADYIFRLRNSSVKIINQLKHKYYHGDTFHYSKSGQNTKKFSNELSNKLINIRYKNFNYFYEKWNSNIENINESNVNDIYKYPFNNPANKLSMSLYDIEFAREKSLQDILPSCKKENNAFEIKLKHGISFPRPNVIIIDNFYKNVDEIRNYALSQIYQPPENHGAVGYRCESGKKIMDGTKKMFETLLGGTIPNGSKHGEWGYSTNGCFQWCNVRVPIVYHCDSQKYAAIIYLTPNAPPNCGTSFFRHKNYKIRNSSIFSKSDWYKSDLNHKEPHLDKTQWEIVDSVGNVYNRLVIFDAQYIHAVTEYFGEDINNSRLFQLFFFNIN
jgi:FkbM family methyltransferase